MVDRRHFHVVHHGQILKGRAAANDQFIEIIRRSRHTRQALRDALHVADAARRTADLGAIKSVRTHRRH